jgi:acetyl-CoA C-acetyltransferase
MRGRGKRGRPHARRRCVSAQLYDSVLRDGLNDIFSDAPSGWHTEDLVEKYQVTRDPQDRWALRSQQRFATSLAGPTARRFQDSLKPMQPPALYVPLARAAARHRRYQTGVASSRIIYLASALRLAV